jgi:HSP20 family molecular chaperone IbpA
MGAQSRMRVTRRAWRDCNAVADLAIAVEPMRCGSRAAHTDRHRRPICFPSGRLDERSVSFMKDMHGKQTRATWTPRVDVLERNGQLVLHADLSGMREQDVRVEVDDARLVISGDSQHEHEDGGVYPCERSFGSFERNIPLPEGVNADAIQASFGDGVLEVTMPMPRREQKRRTIPIRPKNPTGTGVQH